MSNYRFKNINELRKSYSLTQSEMSYFIGVSVRNYREKERGNIPFSQTEIMKMILLFDLTADDVYHLFYIKSTGMSFWKSESLKTNVNRLLKMKENKIR